MRTEIHPEANTQNRFEQIASAGIAENGKFVGILENAGERMARKTKYKSFDLFLERVIGIPIDGYHYDHRVFITDKADKLPFPSTVYHVSGGTALKSLQEGKLIIPSNAHYLGDVITDKGTSLHLVPAFMEALGIPLGNLKEFVFSGSQIDAEQIVEINKRVDPNTDVIKTQIFLQQKNGKYFLADDLDMI